MNTNEANKVNTRKPFRCVGMQHSSPSKFNSVGHIRPCTLTPSRTISGRPYCLFHGPK